MPLRNTLAADDLINISEFFALRKISGTFMIRHKWEGYEIYIQKPAKKPQYLGFTEGGPPSGIGQIANATRTPREVTFAMSKDGRSLVFSQSGRKVNSQNRLESGIYQYVVGEGLKSHPGKLVSGLSNGKNGKEIPTDILPFKYTVTFSPEDLLWALRATGEVFPMALLEGSPLHWAAFEGRTEECVKMISEEADPNEETYWGFTALDLAIIRNHEETAIQLLELGAIPDSGRYPALHRAVMLGRMKVVKAILAQGVDVNSADDLGYTPLHLAAFAGTRLVGGVNDFFANAESPRSIMDMNVTTPLIQILLENGANPSLPDRYGKTAFDSVGRQTPQEAKQLLQAVSPVKADECDEALLYQTADAHPSIRWISTRQGASRDAALGCILRSDKDNGTIELAAYMSSGLYRFIRECGREEGKVYRLFEYKDRARPYLLRLHANPHVVPRTYIVVDSYRNPVGSYFHQIAQKDNDASAMTLCAPVSASEN